MEESLYVPWKESPSGMESELATFESIQRKNVKEFSELKNTINNLPIFNIKCPVREDQYKGQKNLYQQTEKKCRERAAKCENEYNRLLQKETQLLKEIAELEKSSKKRQLGSEDLEEELAKKTKIYKEEKSVLNIAKKEYNCSFGTEVEVEERSGDLLIATLRFNGKMPIKFTMRKATNEIIAFDASSLHSDDKVQQLKSDFEATGDTLSLICALRKLAINR